MHTVIQILSVLPTVNIQKNGIPIYVQIRDQLRRAIGAGVLGPGEQMPTMRQVAVALKVDLNTVRHAYDELQQAGAIVILPARGTYVAEQPPKADPVEHADRLESFAQQVIASATAAGLDAGAVARCIAQVTMKKEAKS